MEKKEVILKKLENTYCRLQPSMISGVGVFAIRDIPQGINPFQGAQEPEWIETTPDAYLCSLLADGVNVVETLSC